MTIENELIDNLLKDYKKPEDIIGENGLLKQLTKQLLERAVAKVDPKLYDAYAGEYRFSPSYVYVVTVEGGRLMSQGMDQGKPSGPKQELLTVNETTFFSKGETGEIVFVKNDKGEVTTFLSRDQGREIKATRIK
jgi:hypothetical protein